MEILTGEQMRNVDRRTIDDLGIPGLLLMEAAGAGVASALIDDYPDAGLRGVLVLCGKGNNGGDGLVAARHLARRGVIPRVILLAAADSLRGDAAINLRAARGSGLEVVEVRSVEDWRRAASVLGGSPLVVDAILGTGMTPPARGLAAEVIEDLNRSGLAIVAVDLPSGLHADRSTVAGPAVAAERTYTLCRPKPCLIVEPAAGLAGRWSVIPIGVPHSAVLDEQPALEWLDAEIAAALLPGRAADSHKGTHGHLLAVAGSRDKSGAAVLLTRGALRAGVGLITVATAASSQERVAVQQAELMSEPLAETATGCIARDAAGRVLELLLERDALAVGPGLGTGDETRGAVLSILSTARVPLVVDADALNALAGPDATTLFPADSGPRVLTPHPGEAARLLGTSSAEVQSDRLQAAGRLARQTGSTVVLKGHRTVVAGTDGRRAINSTGNPGMASGGTGDVLTGMLGAYLARGLSAWDAARLAVFVHGAAGDLAAAQVGQDGLTATDLANEIPAALTGLRGLPGRPRRW